MTRTVMTGRRWIPYGACAALMLGACAVLVGTGRSHTHASADVDDAGLPPPPSEKVSPSPVPKGYVCYRARGPVRIDGQLDDDAWNAAPWTDDFVDIEGDIRPRPRFRTRA